MVPSDSTPENDPVFSGPLKSGTTTGPSAPLAPKWMWAAVTSVMFVTSSRYAMPPPARSGVKMACPPAAVSTGGTTSAPVRGTVISAAPGTAVVSVEVVVVATVVVVVAWVVVVVVSLPQPTTTPTTARTRRTRKTLRIVILLLAGTATCPRAARQPSRPEDTSLC